MRAHRDARLGRLSGPVEIAAVEPFKLFFGQVEAGTLVSISFRR